jgi:hypothetical protein
MATPFLGLALVLVRGSDARVHQHAITSPLTVSGLTEHRVSVPKAGKRLLPLLLRAKSMTCSVLQFVRRFYRSGAEARSLTEVVAAGIKKLEPVVTD